MHCKVIVDGSHGNISVAVECTWHSNCAAASYLIVSFFCSYCSGVHVFMVTACMCDMKGFRASFTSLCLSNSDLPENTSDTTIYLTQGNANVRCLREFEYKKSRGNVRGQTLSHHSFQRHPPRATPEKLTAECKNTMFCLKGGQKLCKNRPERLYFESPTSTQIPQTLQIIWVGE